jgi:hypothetical protein
MAKQVVFKQVFLLFFGLCICVACQKKIDAKYYFQWLTKYENGLHQNVVAGNYVYDIQYKPSITDSMLKTKEAIVVGLAQLQDSSQQYYIKISPKKQGKTLITDTLLGQTFAQRIAYFNYQFAKDISLVQDGKKYLPVFYHAEQVGESFGSSGFIVVFDAVVPQTNKRYLQIHSPLLLKDTLRITFNPLIAPKN